MFFLKSLSLDIILMDNVTSKATNFLSHPQKTELLHKEMLIKEIKSLLILASLMSCETKSPFGRGFQLWRRGPRHRNPKGGVRLASHKYFFQRRGEMATYCLWLSVPALPPAPNCWAQGVKDSHSLQSCSDIDWASPNTFQQNISLRKISFLQKLV